MGVDAGAQGSSSDKLRLCVHYYNLLQQQGAQELTKSVTSLTYWASASTRFSSLKLYVSRLV
jgi:hypothetical protein